MKEGNEQLSLYFIVNQGSGDSETDLATAIRDHFRDSGHSLHFFELKKDCRPADIRADIERKAPDRVIAAGGDGTVKLAAECLLESKKPLGILPAGSANGMAKELGIPQDLPDALEVAVSGIPTAIHAVSVNGELCIHLADLGFNAFLVKKFDSLSHRGMFGYAKAALHALWNHRKMDVELDISGETVHSQARMVVIANATMYGTGVKINPTGSLTDDLFEVVLVKEYSLVEVLKMRFTRKGFDPEKVEFFPTPHLRVRSRRRMHLQVDGEYLGKIREVEARILPSAIRIILPSAPPA